MDGPTPLTPANALETALVAARKGEIPVEEFLAMLLDGDVAVPSATEVLADGSGFTPLVYDKEGTGMVAVFTSVDRASTVEAHARHAMTINARAFLRVLSADVGLVVNPGYAEGIDVSPQGVRELLREFGEGAESG